jgi:hypothetical protein
MHLLLIPFFSHFQCQDSFKGRRSMDKKHEHEMCYHPWQSHLHQISCNWWYSVLDADIVAALICGLISKYVVCVLAYHRNHSTSSHTMQ